MRPIKRESSDREEILPGVGLDTMYLINKKNSDLLFQTCTSFLKLIHLNLKEIVEKMM